MPRQHGPWTIEATTEKHRDAFLSVREDRVIRPDGRPGSYATVTVKPGVAILPVDDSGDTFLVRQYRYALGAESIEVACGGIDEGETPAVAARRELREELGIEATDWRDLGTIDLDTSLVRCKMGLFVAKGLTHTETQREGTEAMETIRVPLGDALRMVLEGEITHAASGLLILKAWMDPSTRRVGQARGPA